MFYTYAHYTPEGRLFYIGKGTGSYRRAYRLIHRNAHWNNVVAKYGAPTVKILAHWDEEWKAFAHEQFLIAHFKSLGFSLCNMTLGGEGSLGLAKSEVTKQKLSIAAKGRAGRTPSIETRRKLSESHKGQRAWNKGIVGVVKQSTETIEKKASKMRGRLYNAEFTYTGTATDTGHTVRVTGHAQMQKLGFSPSCVRRCAEGARKQHKGYTWTRRPLKMELQC